jgi:dihydroorotate dehydrogenase (fumarate)
MAPTTPLQENAATAPVSDVNVSMATTVAGISLSKVLLNSPNPFATTVDNLQALANSPASGAFMTRTACPNFEHDDAKHQWREWGSTSNTSSTTTAGGGGNTINCLGYSCHTLEYYCDAVQKVQTTSNKPAFISITGYAHESAEMLKKIGTVFGDTPEKVLVEINLSCPNIPGKPPIAYDFVGMKEYLTTVFAAGGAHGLKVGVKLTPYFYDGQFVEAADVLNEFYPDLSFVTSINTVGCALVVDVETEAPILASASCYGGIAGPAVHATALGNVRRLRQLLRPELDVVGSGGVDSGEAAFRHLLCGAQAVMVASAILSQGVGVLEKIETELLEIMTRKGYKCIEDFQGKLKDGTTTNVNYE